MIVKLLLLVLVAVLLYGLIEAHRTQTDPWTLLRLKFGALWARARAKLAKKTGT